MRRNLVTIHQQKSSYCCFLQVLKGADVVQNIEKSKTNPKDDKPYEDIKIVNIEMKQTADWDQAEMEILSQKINSPLMKYNKLFSSEKWKDIVSLTEQKVLTALLVANKL